MADLKVTVALAACRDQFGFYAAEHRNAGKIEKAETNERFRDLCDAALSPASEAERGGEREAIEQCARVAASHAGKLAMAKGHDDGTGDEWYSGGKAAAVNIAAAIRALPVGEGVDPSARSLLQQFLIALTGGGKNHARTLTIDHDRLMELCSEARHLLSLTPSTDTPAQIDTKARARELLAAARIGNSDLFGDACREETALRAIEAALSAGQSAQGGEATVVRDQANSHCFDHQIVVDGECVGFASDPWADRVAAALSHPLLSEMAISEIFDESIVRQAVRLGLRSRSGESPGCWMMRVRKAALLAKLTGAE